MDYFHELASNIAADTTLYSGGPLQYFESAGRDTIINLLREGLRPNHKLLDFGCGALRLGYWLIRLLDRDCYFGIEPEPRMLSAGRRYILTDDLILKNPRFDGNAECDFSVFREKFDFVVARSIFTHMSPGMLRKSLGAFKGNTQKGAVFLSSYWPLDFAQKGIIGDEMSNDDWQFRSVIKYSLDCIRRHAAEFGLTVEELSTTPRLNDQVWLKFMVG